MKSEPFKPYPAYKASATEWLARIPGHWEKWKLGHAFKLVGSGTTPPTHEAGFYDGDIPWVTTSELRETVITETEKCVSLQAVKASPTLRTYPAGSLAFAMYGATIGRLGIFGVPATVNQACCVFSNPVAADTKFIFYWLLARRPVLIALSSGGGQPNLNQAELRSIRAELPPVEEQRAIAAFLDRETARLDGLVAQKEKLLALLEEKRASLITHAVTRGLNPHAPTKPSGIPWLGHIPKHWAVQRLQRLVRYGTSITYGIVQAGPDVENGIPYIRTSDMAGDSLPRDGYLRTTPEIDASYRRSKVQAGDLVIAIRATVGKTLPVPDFLDGANLTQGTAKIAPGPRVNAGYLYWVLNSRASQQGFATFAKGVTFREITLEMLRKFVVPLPPLPEQEAVNELLVERTAKFTELLRQIRVGIEKLRERRTALISAAVTGQIDVRKA